MWTFLKKCLFSGALLVLPGWLAVLLLAALLVKLEVIVKPLIAILPVSVAHSKLVAVLLMLLLFLLAGALLQTWIGRSFHQWFEKTVLERIPGYSTFRSIGRQIVDTDGEAGFKPALVEIEDALAPCFVIELLSDDHCTVFVPSAPTPAAGTIMIIQRSRVHPIDVPISSVFQTVSKWGNGAGELFKALPAGTTLPGGVVKSGSTA